MKKILAALLTCLVMACGASQLTAQDDSNLAQYSAQQSACVAAFAPNKAAIDTCRAQVKAAWDAKFNAQFDGGFGASDAGGQ